MQAVSCAVGMEKRSRSKSCLLFFGALSDFSLLFLGELVCFLPSFGWCSLPPRPLLCGWLCVHPPLFGWCCFPHAGGAALSVPFFFRVVLPPRVPPVGGVAFLPSLFLLIPVARLFLGPLWPSAVFGAFGCWLFPGHPSGSMPRLAHHETQTRFHVVMRASLRVNAPTCTSRDTNTVPCCHARTVQNRAPLEGDHGG